jgi:hypothetical protein
MKGLAQAFALAKQLQVRDGIALVGRDLAQNLGLAGCSTKRSKPISAARVTSVGSSGIR